MEFQAAAEHLDEMLSKTKIVFLHTEPEVLDFTTRQGGTVVIMGGGKRLEIDLTPEVVTPVMGMLAVTAFDKESVQTLLTWNLKSLMSYFRFFAPSLPAPSITPLDLQVIEKFLGVEKECPKNLVEAVDRMKAAAGAPNWKRLYQALHLPLMLRVLPALETTPLLDEQDKTSKYAFYEIEGQHNGRLRCAKKFDKGYIPHTMSDDQKKLLKPRGWQHDEIFMTFDIRHCEASVLQWLSQDEVLQQILNSGQDLYREIYRIITGDACDTDKKREMTKLMFLPVMYGCGHQKLAENLNVSAGVARELISRIHARFPTAVQCMLDFQKAAENGPVVDRSGRPRVYTDKHYQARNLAVQGVAATVCLEKLVGLYNALSRTSARLCFTIHDGYGVLVNVKDTVKIYKIIHEIIETESKLCPRLFLKAECKVGPKLDSMTTFQPTI